MNPSGTREVLPPQEVGPYGYGPVTVALPDIRLMLIARSPSTGIVENAEADAARLMSTSALASIVASAVQCGGEDTYSPKHNGCRAPVKTEPLNNPTGH
eukprot:scaffold7076_cov112-Isochrysis_galbana.AAC.1